MRRHDIIRVTTLVSVTPSIVFNDEDGPRLGYQACSCFSRTVPGYSKLWLDEAAAKLTKMKAEKAVHDPENPLLHFDAG